MDAVDGRCAWRAGPRQVNGAKRPPMQDDGMSGIWSL